MNQAKEILQTSETAQRLVIPEGVTAKVLSAAHGRGVAFIFDDGSELTVGKVNIEHAAWAPPAISADQSWIDHAYPLQQITVQLQGTRHSDRNAIIAQLETVLARLRAGDLSGQDHDDDFGYRFNVDHASEGPTFFDGPAGSN